MATGTVMEYLSTEMVASALRYIHVHVGHRHTVAGKKCEDTSYYHDIFAIICFHHSDQG